ncbi:MAG: 6-phosphogluconolactonase [Myxococcota bacterium]
MKLVHSAPTTAAAGDCSSVVSGVPVSSSATAVPGQSATDTDRLVTDGVRAARGSLAGPVLTAAAAIAERPEVEPSVYLLFGGAGDLARKKLYTTFYGLYDQGLLPEAFRILSVDRIDFEALVADVSTKTSDADRAAFARLYPEVANHPNRKALTANAAMRLVAEAALKQAGIAADPGFLELIEYQRVDLGSEPRHDRDMRALGERLTSIEDRIGAERLVIHKALPQFTYEHVLRGLWNVGALGKDSGSKVTVIGEKPFGTSGESAAELSGLYGAVVDESQVVRIDHYLGKEALLNFMSLRFSDGGFEKYLNADYVRGVRIRHAESVGIEGRGYFDAAGITRDMVQSHLLLVLAYAGMAQPSGLSTDAIGDARDDFLDSLKLLGRDRQQYTAGAGPDGKGITAYRDEEAVPNTSETETYVAMKLKSSMPQWKNTPFVITSGKALNERALNLDIEFRELPGELIGVSGVLKDPVLNVRFQPEPEIALVVNGERYAVTPDRDAFPLAGDDPYARCIFRVLCGKNDLSVSKRAIETTWGLVDPMLSDFQRHSRFDPLGFYPAGSAPDLPMSFLSDRPVDEIRAVEARTPVARGESVTVSGYEHAVFVGNDSDAAYEQLLQDILGEMAGRDSFTIGLAGGSTPKALYAKLVSEHREDIDWNRTHLIVGDERMVPRGAEVSNYRMFRESLIEPLRLSRRNVHAPPPNVLDPGVSAELYQEHLHSTFGSDFAIDFQILGMGDDGHVAGVFSGSHADGKDVLAVEERPKDGLGGVSLSLDTFKRAKNTAVLVTGAEKAEMVKKAILEGGDLPVQQLGNAVRWYLDPEAARVLQGVPLSG